MTKALASQEREQSLGEEIANSVSHGVGFLAAVAASPVLVFCAVQRNSSAGIVGASIFAFTMVLISHPRFTTRWQGIRPNGYSRFLTMAPSSC
jgi:predicted membrane channel-forming protein YqfA (hemolysin III family)